MISDSMARKHLSFAKEIAVKAGRLLLKKRHQRNKIKLKGRVNLVTDADLASEKFIIGAVEKKYPDHSILTEEEFSVEKKSDYKWIIDPLDGTTNYAHDFPFWCVSVGLEYQGETVVGVVYDPMRDELFYASRKNGSCLNRRKIVVSSK